MTKVASKITQMKQVASELHPMFSPELEPRVLLVLQEGQLVQVSQLSRAAGCLE